MDEVIESLGRDVHVSLDLDVLDPALMPAVGTPEPGGLSWSTLLDLLRAVSLKRRIMGIDMTELTPLPGNPASDFVAAKTLYRLIGYALASMAREGR